MALIIIKIFKYYLPYSLYCRIMFLALSCFTLSFFSLFFHFLQFIYNTSNPSVLSPVCMSPSSDFYHYVPPVYQLNITALDWTQLSKKECVKYGGSLVGNSCKFVPDLALMSFILFFGTYSMTVTLKKFKFSRYFPTKVRPRFLLS